MEGTLSQIFLKCLRHSSLKSNVFDISEKEEEEEGEESSGGI